MALPTIAPADFIGFIKIVANSFKDVDLQDYIDLFYKKYLRQIIGDAAYIDAETNTLTKWTDLLNGVDYTNDDDKKVRCDGLVKAIKLFIYFEFVRDNFISTQVGMVHSANENSDIMNGAGVSMTVLTRFNDATEIVNNNIPPFLDFYQDITEAITGSLDNLDNTYTISVASTKYLYDGDTVTIEGNDYVISGLIDNTSFIIDFGSTGESFTGDAVWHPYDKIDYTKISVATFV